MSKASEGRPKEGFIATMMEAMKKMREGCGPGCCCPVEEKKDEAKTGKDAKRTEKKRKKK